ncbi:hypothetical protein AAFF_G00053280 [Aldrovandia affinis]|uniref:Uncharacterized protein n=1 Tax=Aldrovandia affinis TaxID=143900 RepID=A0AAD7T507_9TELE|nr:hypothetical protein AAFF_G00053280 [Aldrovandia affinis]
MRAVNPATHSGPGHVGSKRHGGGVLSQPCGSEHVCCPHRAALWWRLERVLEATRGLRAARKRWQTEPSPGLP